MTCVEFENLRAYGDPDYELTREYLRANTKGCPGPGCGVKIEKGSGCFHMTCKFILDINAALVYLLSFSWQRALGTTASHHKLCLLTAAYRQPLST